MGTSPRLCPNMILVFFKGFWVGEYPGKCAPPSTIFIPSKLLGTVIKDTISGHRNNYDVWWKNQHSLFISESCFTD